MELPEFLEKNDLEYEHGFDEYTYYIGLSINKIRDDQTFGDFKKEVKEKLVNIGIEKDPELIFESFVYT